MTGSSTASPPTTVRVPSVLVALVVRDAEPWLRDSLSALAAQIYPRLGVIAVDNASSDASHEILLQALGERRVMRLPEDRGLAGSLEAVLEITAAREADYLLILHDDAMLDPDGVTRLVEAAIAIQGVSNVGVVGAKVVDWDDPRSLRDVGRSADRFGHPYTPLQQGEIDQGQFDRVLEVLGVESCAMLVSRETWERIGLFDERLDAQHEDLDFCWRARVAGFHVLMTPMARARHRSESAVGEREGRAQRRRSERYLEDRAALASMMKNYGPLSLLWLLPLTFVLGLARLLILSLSRRFEEAFDVLAAWGWNIAHLPGTVRRRWRAQRARAVPDRQLRKFMESAGLRLPRWFEKAERILEEQREIEEADQGRSVSRRLRDRTASLIGEHPVVVASFVGIVVGALATRGLFGNGALNGGVLPMFPAHPGGFFSELVSAFRTTGLGGPLAASPALGAAGGLSWLLFGSTALAQKVLLAAGPAVAAILMYRALARLAGRPGAAVLGAGAYGLSAAVLWAFSEGRLGLLVAMAILPALVERLEVAFGADEPADGRGRFVAGLGVTLAVGVAFEPGVVLAFALIVLVQLALGRARARGLMLSLLAGVAAAGLLFPFLPTLAAGGGRALGSLIGTTDLARLVRLSISGGPGTWLVAAFLPISAALGLALAGPGLRARALRAAVVAVLGLALAWLSSAGWLPAAAANAPIYLTLSAAAEAMLVCFGLASVLGVGRESFGARQIGTALLAVVLGAGLFLQAVSAMVGGWGWGGAEKVPAAWAVVQSAAKGEFNVLWVGEGGRAFPPPGGDPQAVAAAGDASLRYGLTGRDGTQAVDVGRPVVGPGGQALGAALAEILAGRTLHGGALLAPFGIRFIVAGQGTVPPAATARLRAQVDLDPVPALGLVIYRNAAALPPAGALSLPPATAKILSSSDPAVIQQLGQVPSVPLSSVTGGWNGPAPQGSFAYVATQYSGSWRVNGAGASPAFGWATTAPAGGPVAIRYAAQLPRTIEIWLLAVLWLAALWVTRKPVVR